VATPEGLQQLREILTRYPGKTEVYLSAPQSSKRFRLGADIKVNVDDAAGELLTVFGANLFQMALPNEGVSAVS